MRRFLERLFGITPCKHCGSWDTHRGHYTSGYNNLCQQASGDRGLLCCTCWHIEFDKSFEERQAINEKHSPWVTLYK